MKPGETAGSIVIESQVETEDVADALIDFCFDAKVWRVEKKMDFLGDPIELPPDEAHMVLVSLKKAVIHPTTSTQTKERILNMLTGYIGGLASNGD